MNDLTILPDVQYAIERLTIWLDEVEHLNDDGSRKSERKRQSVFNDGVQQVQEARDVLIRAKAVLSSPPQ